MLGKQLHYSLTGEARSKEKSVKVVVNDFSKERFGGTSDMRKLVFICDELL